MRVMFGTLAGWGHLPLGIRETFREKKKLFISTCCWYARCPNHRWSQACAVWCLVWKERASPLPSVTVSQASRSGMFANLVAVTTVGQTADAYVEPFRLDLLSHATGYLFIAITAAILAKGQRCWNTPWGYSILRNGSYVIWQQLFASSSACNNLSKRRTAVFFSRPGPVWVKQMEV